MLIEATIDHTALAVPLYENGAVVASLGVFLPSYRFDAEHREAIVHELLKISAQTKT